MTLQLLFDNYNVTPEQEEEITRIHTSKNIYNEIEAVVKSKKLSYIDAVVHYCETTGLEVEVAGSLIRGNAKLKAMIQQEAEDLHYLPRTEKLPI